MDLFKRYREQGDLDAREQILNSHINMVRAIAHQMCFDKSIFEDAVQEGIIGILTAIESFDYNRSIKFSTYCNSYIFKSIYLFVNKFHYRCKVPDNYFHLVSRLKDIDTTDMPLDAIKEILSSEKWNVTDDIATHLVFLSKNSIIESYDKNEKFFWYAMNIPEQEDSKITEIPTDVYDRLSNKEIRMLNNAFGINCTFIAESAFQKRYNITKEEFINNIKRKLNE